MAVKRNIQYSLSRMIGDLRCDFDRYSEYYGNTGDLSLLEKLLVFFKSPAFWVIANHRFGYFLKKRFEHQKKNPFHILGRIIYFTGKYFGVCLVKIDMLVGADIGPGLFLSNKGNMVLGITKMGKGATIHEKVTIGGGQGKDEPSFGDYVWIGSNSIIYGGIEIGSGTIIQECTVLSKSIPKHFVVGGNPCRIIKKDYSTGPYPVSLDQI